MPQRTRQPNLEGASVNDFLRVLRDPGRNLKEQFKNRPLDLAERLGLLLPRKPVQKMIELGVITEEEAEERFGKLYPGLREMIQDVCLLETRDAAAVASRGGGKALAVHTPIPTPDGWKPMGELQVGDRVFDENGVPCRVTKAYPVMSNRPCYEVVFSDGSSVVADEDHLWFTRSLAENRAGSVKTTKQISESVSYGSRQDRNHRIDNTGPLSLPERELPLDPYLLGVWLGDGTSTTGAITCGQDDRGIIGHLRKRGHSVHVMPSSKDRACYIRVDGLTTKLREMGLILGVSNKAHKNGGMIGNKHVPAEYLRASESQRLDLLAGLMDTDGTTRATNNNCQFDSTTEALADAVYELVVSLGWKASRGKKTAKLYEKECGVVHRVSFRPTRQVFRNPRKKARLNFSVGQESRHLNRTIVAVRPVPSVPVRCIEVDSESRLFLCGEQMVPTHNSYGVSFIEFYLWLVLDFDALNLGGSELQADNVYQYLIGYIESDQYWKTLLKTDPQREKTFSVEDSWVRVLTASSKSVRSPHAGGKRRGKIRGGLLVIDEEAEADAEIVEAALPTINTAMPSVNVRCSTFHNVAGSFADLIDNHEVMGYKLYKWDTFDVCAGCECVDTCQSPEPCFREDHKEIIINPDNGQPEEKLIHKAYCGGRAMYAEGWVPMSEIEALWRRLKRNHARWEVEAMGQRPSSSGYVVLDMQKFNQSITSESAATLYVPGNPVDIDVDWGTGAGAIEVWQEVGKTQRLLHADLLMENNRTQMFGSIIGYATRYEAELVGVNCDIGGGGNYLNQELRDNHRLPVNDVNFSEVKETAAAALNIYNDAGNLMIPAEFEDFIAQVRGWRRANGRIAKGNDHLCDAMLCHFAGFIDRLGLSKVSIPPRSFRSNPDVADSQNPRQVSTKQRMLAGTQSRGRVAIARGFGGSKRR